MKLRKEDVQFLNEGQQIKKAVLDRFGSVEAFVAETNIGMDVESIKNYMRKEVVKSQKFRCRLVQIFNMDFNEIVLNKETQLGRFVDRVYLDIEEYSEEGDYEVLNHLRNLCIETGNSIPIIKMYRNIGMYYFHRGVDAAAMEMLRVAITMLEGKKNDELLINCLSELGLIYLSQDKKEDAKVCFDKIKSKLAAAGNISDSTKAIYHYRSGILNTALSMPGQARQEFQEALKYTDDDTLKGYITLHIGITYKTQGSCYEALKHYEQALAYFESGSNMRGCTAVYSHMAEAYMIQERCDTALKYAEKAVEGIKYCKPWDDVIPFRVYSEIQCMKGEPEEVAYKLTELLAKTKDSLIYRKLLREGIRIMKQEKINIGEQVFEKLGQKIIKRLRRPPHNEKEYENTLMMCLGALFQYSIEKGYTLQSHARQIE